jgi:putative transcriptional regulator
MHEITVENTLKVHRAIKDLTQADLADLAGITRASVNAIEGGRMTPSILLALKLAEALDVSVDEIFRLSRRRSEQKSPKPRARTPTNDTS